MNRPKSEIRTQVNEGIQDWEYKKNIRKKNSLSKEEFQKCNVHLTEKQNNLYKGIRNNIDNKREEDQVFELLQNSKNHIKAPNEFEPHEASGMGFCYVGEDRGFRSCIKVGKADKCMSGDIFPTQDVCINPSLRA